MLCYNYYNKKHCKGIKMKKLLILLLISAISNAATIYIPNLQKESNVNINYNTDVYNNQIKKEIKYSNLFQLYNHNYNYSVDKESGLKESSPNSIYPDFILVGEIIDYSNENLVSNIINTNKSSDVYSINILVSYHLIRTKDNEIVAEFNSYGSGGNALLIDQDSSLTNPNRHNIPLLINKAAISLSNDVLINLNSTKIN